MHRGDVYTYVDADNRGGAREAVRHLADRNHPHPSGHPQFGLSADPVPRRLDDPATPGPGALTAGFLATSKRGPFPASCMVAPVT
ncbi:hypothetical protein AB0I94_21900 [Streptomyces sp. NPDC050147]|uniref:hypothetical protein n=1 Tax=Streptomyces sp. NPDC050147 TaxID=3155513 RepID=UPI00343D82C0